MQTIAIVDDHDIFRNGLIAVLKQSDTLQPVGDFSNGADFLEYLRNNRPPDIVLMDINMPKMNGIEATTKSLELVPEIKILILSMYDDVEYYNKFIDLGVKGFILKDANFDELTMAIDKILNGGTFFSQALLLKMLHKKEDNQKIILTEREKEVLDLIAMGLSTNEISDKLHISIRTVERHRSNLFLKTNTNNSLKLLVFALKNNLVHISNA